MAVVLRLATGWTVRGSNPRWGDEIFRNFPDRPWVPPVFLYYGYRVSFMGVKRSGRGLSYRAVSSSEVKEIVELYLYSTPFPSWKIIG